MTTGDTDITRLDDRTVEQIAAGEVVERPASVVKELVENSLDAGADRIAVEIEGDGTERVAVVDDGEGMSEADVRAAVRQHTTSKISDAGDLAAGVETLGFRGEALYTVGAVSKTTITTRKRGTERGTELEMAGGEVEAVRPAGCPEGTTVAVEDLFYNVPARRKYLGSTSTEFGHCNRVVTRYALANPGVAVSLTHDGREVFATTGQGDLRAAMMAVYGREVATAMVEVEAEPGGPVGSVSGYVSDPETTRSTREYLSTFVNDRYVSDGLLREAVLSAYGTQLAPDRFPFAVLFVEVPGDAVDVNVHPRKMEVRFDDADGVREAIDRAVRDALLHAGLVRSGAPRGRSAPGDAAIEPGSGDPAPDRGDESRSAKEDGDASETEAGATDDRPPADAGPTARAEPGSSSDARPTDGTATDSDAAPEGDGPGSGRDATDHATDAGESTGAGGSAGGGEEQTGDGPARSGDGPATAGDGRPSPPSERKFRPPTENASLATDRDDERTFDRLPPMQVLGQYGEAYVVAATDDGLVFVDQHAADERVHYERLRAELADGPDSQALVAPVELEVTAGEAAVFADALDALRDLGFEADLADRTARVTAVPTVLADALDPELLRDVLAAVLADDDTDAVVDSAADALLADMACYPAVTGGTSLTEGSVTALLEALDDCENPYACPHGRPTVVEVSDAELADRFERDYPGHQCRRPED